VRKEEGGSVGGSKVKVGDRGNALEVSQTVN
jgi:hypothetical protein